MRICKENNAPIGVFDSGLGGLTVVKQLMKRLPDESIVYYGDTARVPYGTKSKQSIVCFSVENTRVLLKNKVKLVVVACNSSSSYAIPVLKEKFGVPIIDVIEPGSQRAVECTGNGRIGVIATSATIASDSYKKALKKINKNISVISQPCPLFVPLIEEGWSNKSVAVDIAREYLNELKKKKVDTVILGCTHYPLIKNTIRKVLGPDVCLIDSAREVALIVDEELSREGLKRTKKQKAKHKFIVSDKPQKFGKIAKRFLGVDIKKLCWDSYRH